MPLPTRAPAVLLQDRLDAQPVRFMECEALRAIRQAQLALAEVGRLTACRLACLPCNSAAKQCFFN